MEVVIELFNALESNHPQTVEDTKKKFHEHFNSTKESWLLNGMFEYYISTGSLRTVEILVGVREPHERYLFDRLSESLRGPQKLQALTLLGHIVCRHPTWLYKIVNHNLLKDLLRLLKIETEIIPLMSTLLIVIVLLPIIAGLFGPFLQDLFEVFSRLAAWNTNNPNKIPEGHLLHLQVSLYALFNRLYGMYPCNFLSYLRQQYSIRENIPIFSHTIKPMLDTVRMHPLLVTASKDTEVAAARWKKMEANDVIIECAKFSVESGERSRDDCNFRGRTPSFRSRSSLEYSGSVLDGNKLGGTSVCGKESGVGTYSLNLIDGDDVWSPSVFCGAPTPPESAPTSIPHTPIGQNYATSSSFPQQEGTSPPEAAVEATPESTPVKDLRQMVVRAPPAASSVARALNSFAVIQQSTQSQPSSPMKKEPSPFRFPPASTPPVPHESGSAFQAASIRPKETSIVMQRVQRVVLDRIQMEKEGSGGESRGSLRPKAPGGGYQPSSPLRVIPHPTAWDNSVPNSPQLLSSDHTEEDKEVETTMRLDNPPTPVQLLQLKRGDSVLHDPGAPEGEEFEDCHESSEKGCVEGGLHMPDSRSMIQFARQVNRLRFFSQCAPDNFHLNQIGISSGSSPREGSGFPDVKVRRAISCPEMKKTPSASTALSDLGVSALDETVEEELEDLVNLNGYSSQIPEKFEQHVRLVSCSTQTDDPQPLVYEHLFLSVFPPLEQQQQHSAPPDVHSPPLFNSALSRYSPYTALESYIEATVKSHSEKVQRHQGIVETELKACQDQMMLLVLQLQYERHRREVHAERNRRLLGKSRSNRALEEHNSALRDQVSLLQKDIETLRSELERNKREAKYHSDSIQQTVLYWQDQSSILQKECKEAKAQISLLEQELKEEKQHSDVIIKDFNSAQAAVFELENSLRSVIAEASAGREIRNELSALQHRLAVAGEIEDRLKMRLANLTRGAHAATERLLASQGFHQHATDLQQHLNNRETLLDAAKARLTELELALERKDALISEQKHQLQTVKEDYDQQIKAMDKKCNQLREINHKQEESVLELLQRIEALELSGKKSSGAAGGSQAGSPPLSTSLSSSGTLSLSGAEPPQIKNLQLLVDTPELPGSSKDQLSPL